MNCTGAVFSQLYSLSLLTLTAISGDYLLIHTPVLIYRMLVDNLTHALIGGISWFIVCNLLHNRYVIIEIIICTIVSSLIDVDHFLMAKSLSFHNATELKVRPPFHCSTIPFLLSVLICLSRLIGYSRYFERMGILLVVAFVSHHTRDATRRGFWFYPFGSTLPISYIFYIFIILITPFISAYLLNKPMRESIITLV